ncbi:MAG TPA: hypothetical protein VF260_07510 [Bacilli bacterium]
MPNGQYGYGRNGEIRSKVDEVEVFEMFGGDLPAPFIAPSSWEQSSRATGFTKSQPMKRRNEQAIMNGKIARVI